MISCRTLKIALLVLSFSNIFALRSGEALGEEVLLSVPRASCGSTDRTEAVQGEATLAERYAPGPAKAYQCNLELIGQSKGEGSGFGLITFENCAYYSTYRNLKMQHPGVAVLDVSDSRHPHVTTYLETPAMLAANESMAIDSTHKILIANEQQGVIFDIYDLSVDCRHPILKRSISLPRVQSHAGTFSADGRTFYGASDNEYLCNTCGGNGTNDPAAPPPSAVFALDVTDPTRPHVIATWIPPNKNWLTHSVSVSRDGTRAYVVLWRPQDDGARASNPNGLVILDIADVKARKANPQFRLVSTLFWDDTHFSQFAVPVEINEKPYLIWTDISGTIGLANPPPNGLCSSHKSTYGFARIVDIGVESHPQTVSRLMLEVSSPANCSKVIHEPTLPFGYGSEACDVNNPNKATMLACGYYEAGLRVFDIRDPVHPKEIAYYKPPPTRMEAHLATPFQTFFPTFDKDHNVDWVIVPRFHNKGEEIWFNSFDNGFQVVRFTDHFKTTHQDLFPK